jgi:putative drug exporter of the RND superfamily
MRGLAHWCIRHRLLVAIVWIVVAVGTTVVAQKVGPSYSTVYTLPGTETQRAHDLLAKEFPTQSGDVDQIVFHTTQGTIDSPAVRGAIEPLLAKVSAMPHVVGVISPYSTRGAVQVSPDRRTAFATINYNEPASQMGTATGKPVLEAVKAVNVPGLTVAAGGQVIEAAEGFSVGPATEVGVIAALIILLITFGSLTAAGLPLITAGFALFTGVAVIEFTTYVIDMPNVSTQLALMIGLGVGIDYSLFIVTRFREEYLASGDTESAVLNAMDTSGRAVLLAGVTVIIALLGMFATGVAFMYGLAIAAVIAVMFTVIAALTLLPAALSRFGPRLARKGWLRKRFARSRPEPVAAEQAPAPAPVQAPARSRGFWRSWSYIVRDHPWPMAIISMLIMLFLLIPLSSLRLDSSDAGNDPAGTSTRQSFDMLAAGFGPGFNGPLLIVTELPTPASKAELPALRSRIAATPGIVAVTPPRIAPSGAVAIMSAFPGSAPQDQATTSLVNHLRGDVLPPFKQQTGVTVLVGGFTAGAIDFSNVLGNKLPLFISLVIVLSALLLFFIFRSIVIPIQAAILNLLTIGAAIGATVAVFGQGHFASVLGVQKGPIEAWIPVIMFAVVFGLSMDYEVFLISRIHEEWVRRNDPSEAVTEGIAMTGRVISAAAAIMICVFMSFTLGNERTLKEFGFGLAVAVFVDAIIVRCLLLPSTLELLGRVTWWLPKWLDDRMPRFNIEGSVPHPPTLDEEPAPPAPDASATH